MLFSPKKVCNPDKPEAPSRIMSQTVFNVRKQQAHVSSFVSTHIIHVIDVKLTVYLTEINSSVFVEVDEG